MSAAASDVWMYGDPTSYELRSTIAAKHGISISNVVVGEGVDGLLGITARLLVGPGDTVVTTAGTYPTLNYFVAGCGGTVHAIPYGADDRHDLDALVSKAHKMDAKLVYLVNPDNPSGTWHSGSAIEEMARKLPAGTTLLLDEAYCELGPDDSVPDIKLFNRASVIRCRTFSKAYGMAGARIGYAIGSEPAIASFDKIRNHFGVGRISQAGALAAFNDDEYLESIQLKMEIARVGLQSIAIEFGLTPLDSGTNFVTMDCGRDGNFARAVLSALHERDIFVRMPGTAPLDRCIRVSCSNGRDLGLFKRALPEALEAASRGQ